MKKARRGYPAEPIFRYPFVHTNEGVPKMQQKRLWPKAYLNLPVDETTSSEAVSSK